MMGCPTWKMLKTMNRGSLPPYLKKFSFSFFLHTLGLLQHLLITPVGTTRILLAQQRPIAGRNNQSLDKVAWQRRVNNMTFLLCFHVATDLSSTSLQKIASPPHSIFLPTLLLEWTMSIYRVFSAPCKPTSGDWLKPHKYSWQLLPTPPSISRRFSNLSNTRGRHPRAARVSHPALKSSRPWPKENSQA